MIMELIPGIPDDIARECLIRVPYKHFSKASTVCRAWNSDIYSLHFHNRRKATGLTRTVIVLTQAEYNQGSGLGKYVSPPVYHLTVYEPATGVWERLLPVPSFSTGLPLFCQVAGVGRYLVVMGGWNPEDWKVSSQVHVYDFFSATWKRGADMPGPSRSFFACASSSESDNKMVFVAGGHDEEKNALKSALAYDMANELWISLADMARERDECKGIFQGGKFHVIGGYSSNSQGRFEGSAEAFDVNTWQWDQVKDDVFKSGRCPRTCVADDEGNMYSVSGDHLAVSDGCGATWSTVTELPTEVSVGTYVLMWQGKMMVIGSNVHGGPSSCYELDKDKWTKVQCPDEFRGHVQTGCALVI